MTVAITDSLDAFKERFTIYGKAAYGNGVLVPDAEVTLMDTLEKKLETTSGFQFLLKGIHERNLSIGYKNTVSICSFAVDGKALLERIQRVSNGHSHTIIFNHD